MSRSKPGSKPPGWEPWGRRPKKSDGNKKETHRLERIQGKDEIIKQLKELDESSDEDQNKLNDEVCMCVKLIKDISFYDTLGNKVLIPKGTEVLMDMETEIGVFEGLHFDLIKGEYALN